MVIAEAISIVSTLKSASELADKLRSSDSKDDLRMGASQLADMLFAARGAALAVLEEKAALIDERTELNRRLDTLQRERDHLVDFSDNSQKYERVKKRSSFVYRERQPPGGEAGTPYFCPTCFARKEVSILHPGYGYSGNDGLCFICKNCISISD